MLSIELDGVATNNLKAIDVAFPVGRITVVTGVSGSGKSSLVFDTLYGEAYRRYVESLSSFARQYLKALPKPTVAAVRNLPPAIAVQQSRSGASNRSTVGTSTELIDLVRVLFTHLSRIHCTNCGALVEKDTPESVAKKTLAVWSGRKAIVTAPLARWGKVAAKDLKTQLEAQGFTRIAVERAAGEAPEIVKLETAKAADLKGASIVVDRVKVDPDQVARLIESAGLGLKAGRGLVEIMDEAGERLAFTAGLDCANCSLEYAEPSLALFSFNHPLGACIGCQGFGFASELDWDKVIPDLDASLMQKGVAAWNFGAFAEYYEWAKTSAKKLGLKYDKPFAKYTDADWTWLKKGEGKAFDGISGFFEYLDSKRYKAHYRIHASRFRKYVVCRACGGTRLNPKALACKLAGMDVAGAAHLDIGRLGAWLGDIETRIRAGSVTDNGLDADRSMGVSEALEEARARIGYLTKIGVAYLALDRSARTLSGGELQRINMARCLGSALTDTLFCLDEPSAGLHARDSSNLLEVIRELRDQGNTVVLVEHERTLIQGADHLIEIGPKAGHEGGKVVFAGDPMQGLALTQAPPVQRTRPLRKASMQFLTLKGASTHNLQNIDVRIPVGAITAVCGVSGSGKTSLIQHTFYPLAAKALGQPIERGLALDPRATELGPVSALKAHREVMLVSQAALGRSSRSNIATYLGLMDEIRKLLADQPLAKKLGLMPGSFSFNIAASGGAGNGRCETCKGLGTVVEDLSFLGEMEVICPSCNGRRFGDNVLAVEYRGRNLNSILQLTIAEAREFFFERPAVVRICDLMLSLGMGYLTLGQHTSSFSGGEAQRLKLVSLMRDVKETKPSILIFDEPTTGLSDRDVAALLAQLDQLAAQGHTLVIVEHHLDVLRSVDWLIEVGPEAGDGGGRVVYEGPPAGIALAPESVTRPYLYPAAESARKATNEQVLRTPGRSHRDADSGGKSGRP